MQLNKWSVKVESIDCYALPLNLFDFPCFRLFKENPWKFLALLSFSPVRSSHSFSLKASKQSPTLPQVDLCKKWVSSPHPKLPFPLIQQKPQKSTSNSLYFIPSLILIENIVISSLIDYLFPRLTRREPSPVLVGLATRLSVVWCGPRTLSFQPETNLGSNSSIAWFIVEQRFQSCHCKRNRFVGSILQS